MALDIGTLQGDIGIDTTGLKRDEAEIAKSLKKTDKNLKKTEKAAKNTGTKGFKPMGRNAGQAGIQVQQLVGQLQGGTSAFVAISQQAADFGIVLGAPMIGVIVSLGAVLAGVLFQALTGTKEATDRASTSVAELTQEYLKLIDATEDLTKFNLAQKMKTDAGAIIALGTQLGKLRREREAFSRGGAGKSGSEGVISKKQLEAMDKEIREVDNRFQLLIQQQEFRQKQLNDLFNKGLQERSLQQEETFQTDAPADLGQTFDQAFQKEIAMLQLRSQLFNDTDAKIEAEIMRFELAALNLFEEGSDEFLAAEQALADKRVELRDKANQKILDNDKRAADRLNKQATQSQQASLNGIVQLGDQINTALEGAGREGTAIAKAIFLAQKAIQVATILASTEVAAARAAEVAALGGPVPFFATAAAIRAVGFASAGIVAGLGVSEAFAGGGIVGGGSFSGDNMIARVNSGEMILNQRQQQRLFSIADRGGQSSGSSTAPAITIINEGTPKDFEVESITREEMVLIARDQANNAENRINASLSSGRGRSAAAVRSGFDISRNLNSQRQ